MSELEKKMRQLDPKFGSGATPERLEERIAALEKHMDELLAGRVPPEEASAQALPPAPGPLQPLTPVAPTAARPEQEEQRLPVAGYMEFHFNKFRTQPGELDFHRFVLLFGHSFSDRIKFWSELEVEHALVEGREEKGELELEQAYLDFLIQPWFNLRGGMLLTPVGIINERHEPPSFNGVERPFVETVIIPSTWFEPGFGITGDLGRGLRYRAYLMAGLDASEFDADEGIRAGRQKGFRASFRNPAKAMRLEFSGIRRLTLGTSVYTGHAGFRLLTVNPRVDLFNFDGRYGIGRFDVRGLFAQTWMTRAAQLNRALARLHGFDPNLARQMRGYYFEPAAHMLPRRWRQDAIAFVRYEKFNTQHRMPAGYVPLPEFNRSAWVVGLTLKPNADVAFKFDYVFNRNASMVVRTADAFNVGLGWWF